jgi:CubicO group peptidase (beta-lactamase class C family)
LSTAGDYLRFSQMLLGRGKLGGARILECRSFNPQSGSGNVGYGN